ncbi:MAG: UvrB/UvrC motif-containing protein [Anaerolineae bacterium]
MAERSIECNQCKKPIKVIYKEIIGNSIVCTEMCADCPLLEKKLHGLPSPDQELPGQKEGTSGLFCGKCATALESITMGGSLGCNECYAVFADLIIDELIKTDRIPTRLKKDLNLNKSQPLHVGKSPSQPTKVPLSSRITALSEALNEAIKKENYEQAAWLRDQIKVLMEKSNDTKS